MTTAINHGRELAEAVDRDGFQYTPEQQERDELRREYAPRRRPAREDADESLDPIRALLFFPIPMPLVWVLLVALYGLAGVLGVMP
jgi:hypothetical protein